MVQQPRLLVVADRAGADDPRPCFRGEPLDRCVERGRIVAWGAGDHEGGAIDGRSGERRSERGQVLAPLDRSQSEHVGPPGELGEPRRGGSCRRLVDGEWPEMDDLDVARVPSSSSSWAAVAWLDACTVAPPATRRRSTSPARRTSGDASSGFARNQQSYTETSAGSRLGGTT